MSDLISRSALIEEFEWLESVVCEKTHAQDAIQRIKNAPTIEPYGTWIYDEYGNPHCSRCEHVQDAPTNYCSECGTDMRGDQNE